VRVTFETLGEVQFSRDLLRVGNRGGDMSPVLGSIADDWMDWNQEQFTTEGGRASGGWAALAPSTVKRRGSAHPILQVSGALMEELTKRSNVLVTDSFAHLSIPDDVEEYGRYHQSGTSRMPQRRPIEFTDMDRRQMVRKLQLFVLRGAVA
jgi:Phage virion morphogenesis family